MVRFHAEIRELTWKNSSLSLMGIFSYDNHIVVMPVDVHDVDDLYHTETKQFSPHHKRGTTGRESVWFA